VRNDKEKEREIEEKRRGKGVEKKGALAPLS